LFEFSFLHAFKHLLILILATGRLFFGALMLTVGIFLVLRYFLLAIKSSAILFKLLNLVVFIFLARLVLS